MPTTGHDPPASADLKKIIEDWVWKKFGLKGIAALALVFALGAIWWKWDEVAKVPGIAELAKSVARKPLPKADPNLFSIAIAHLEGDDDHQEEGLLDDALAHFTGADQGSDAYNMQILYFDRTIELKDGDIAIAVSKGHEAARRLLLESGADVLLWGKVLRKGNETVPRLFWTPTHSAGHGKLTDLYPVQGVELPSVFWTDLAQWINLLVESQAAELSKLQGQYAARRLTPFIERTRKVLNFEAHWWDADTRAKVQVLFAYALTIYGQQTGTRQPLEEAVTTLQGTLKEYTRERSPLDWAMTKTALGNALMRLGERERDTDTALLKAAVTAFQEALSERTRDRIPLDWAMTQNNLGMAFTRLGEREAGTADLEAAVKACQDALKEQTRERVPLDWAKTQNLLGAALKTLGEREGNTTRLEDAVTACQEALKERTRERVPLDWAMTQNNLGNALESLAEREGNTGRFEAAATAYQEALKEQKRDQVPLDWALTQNNLGVSLERLGEREGSIARLEAAVATFEEALQVWHGTSGHYEALAQNNLLRAQAALDKVRANEH